MVDLKPLTLILSDDELLLSRTVEENYEPSSDLEKTVLDASTLDAGKLSELLSPSLFSQNVLLIVENCNNLTKNNLNELLKYAPTLNDETRIILTSTSKATSLEKSIKAAGGKTVKLNKVTSMKDKVLFIKEEVKKQNVKITDSAARTLVEVTDGNLHTLNGALKQLISDNPNVVIDENIVKTFYVGNPETKGFAVADAILTGNVPLAISTMRSALNAGTPHVLISSAIISQVRALVSARGLNASNAAELAILLGEPQWKAEKTFRNVSSWSDKALATALKHAVSIDAGVKGEKVNVGYFLEKVALDISQAKKIK